MSVTCNGKPVIAMRLTMPFAGAWVAQLEVDSDDVISGAVTLADDDASYRGTVVRSGVEVGSCYLEAVGGAGGLSKTIDARSYQGISARSVAADICAVAGERLDSSSSGLTATLTYWTRAGGRAGTALSTLAEALGLTWRILPNGAVWMGVDAWRPVPASVDSVELSVDPASGSVQLADATIGLTPGVTLGQRRVGRVEHSVGRDQPARTVFWEAT